MSPFLPENIILIDKPKGISSFDVIRRLRKKLGIRKMGHAGTLDPLATGLMIIGIGPGTKKLKSFVGLPKTYHSQVILGLQTSTGDLEGQILRQQRVEFIDLEHISLILDDLAGTLSLPVPKYSAVKVEGQPLYKRARRGEMITPPIKMMKVLSISLQKHYPYQSFYILELDMRVSSGTYVRSIAEEIGRKLDLPATSGDIRRIRIGDFRVEDAEQL
jgi:tRNA pseudouridine55 synthase